MDGRFLTQNKHDAINTFLQYKQSMGCSEETIKIYSSCFRRFFHDCHPDLAPDEVQPQHIDEYLAFLEAEFNSDQSGNDTMSNQTKRSYLNYLSSFYSWALQRPAYDSYTFNPAVIIAQDIKTRSRDRPDCATWENAKRVVHTMDDPRNRLCAVIMAKTGARVAETVRLQTRDLLLDDGFIRLRDRKGGGDSVVPVDAETVHQIKRYQVIREHPGRDHLFISRYDRPLSKYPVQRTVKEAAVKCGVMAEGEKDFYAKFTSHTFRTVFTTAMRKAGMSDHALAHIRGDADRDMREHYTRVDRDEVRDEYLDCIKPLDL